MKWWWRYFSKLAISVLWLRNPDDDSELDGNNRNLNNDNRAFGMASLRHILINKAITINMKNYKKEKILR